jgi:hypothetical protein
MPNPQSRYMFWTYSPELKDKHDFPDPRIPIARHIAWTKTTNPDTEFFTPEPDNYNRAIFTEKITECTLVEDQVIYYDKVRQGWLTIMYVPDEQIQEIDAWITQSNKLAVWCHLKPPRIKPRRNLLWARGNIRDDTQTDNERLYTMGYYENLKVKYFSDDTTYVDSLLGEARATLKNFVPEEQSETDYDNSLC